MVKKSADLRAMGTRLPFPRAGRGGERPRTAFVLSGGGNQGVAQVGMLRAVIERGIVPDVVIGTSAGALNGAAVAYSPNLTGIAQLEAVWTSLSATEVFPGGKLSRAWNVLKRETHLFEADGLQALVDRESKRFAALGLAHSHLTDERWLEKLTLEPHILKQPLVRSQHLLSIGAAEEQWKSWLG